VCARGQTHGSAPTTYTGLAFQDLAQIYFPSMLGEKIMLKNIWDMTLALPLVFQYFPPAATGRTRGRLFEPGKRSVCRACNFHDSQGIATTGRHAIARSFAQASNYGAWFSLGRQRRLLKVADSGELRPQDAFCLLLCMNKSRNQKQVLLSSAAVWARIPSYPEQTQA